MIRYEYRTIIIDTSAHDMIQRQLNDMGRHGWELVTVYERQYTFKRPLAEIGPSETKVVEPAEKKGTGPLSEAILEANRRRTK